MKRILYLKMKKPLISIIITTYNSENFIDSLTGSVLHQTYTNWECLFVDDGSEDRTLKLLEQVCQQNPKCFLFKKKHQGLPSKTRNFGIRKAKGEYVAFLDHDDIWDPNKLKMQVMLMTQHPEIPLIFTNHTNFYSSQKPRFYKEYSEYTNISSLTKKSQIRDFKKQLAKNNFIPLSSVMVNKQSLCDSNLFNEEEDLKIGEDYLLWLKLSSSGNFAKIKMDLNFNRQHGHNITKDKKALITGLYRISEELKSIGAPKFLLRGVKAQALKSDAIAYIRYNPHKAIIKLKQSLMEFFRFKTFLILIYAYIYYFKKCITN